MIALAIGGFVIFSVCATLFIAQRFFGGEHGD